MFINCLALRNFRNYKELDINLNPNINILYGDNAQGKTNILESLYILSNGKSYRSLKLQELRNWATDKNYFVLKTEVNRQSRKFVVEIRLENDLKSFFVNGVKKTKTSELLEFINVVLFSPENLTLIKGSPSERRKFLDDHLSQLNPQYLHYLKQYEKVLTQRNNLLKSIRGRMASRDSLEIWNEQLWEYGSKIIEKRIDVLKKFSPLIKEIHNQISEGEKLDITYLSSVKLDNLAKIKDSFKKMTDSFLSEEIKRGVTLIGPHRDDLGFFINGRSIQKFGSQGQQRTTVLSLKLTELELLNKEKGDYPILLLDDVMSELDLKRRQYLLGFINDRIQTFITTTNLHSFDEQLLKKSNVLKVNQGTIFK